MGADTRLQVLPVGGRVGAHGAGGDGVAAASLVNEHGVGAEPVCELLAVDLRGEREVQRLGNDLTE